MCVTDVWEWCFAELDECVSSPCPLGSTCVNLVGKFTCTCRVGQYYEPGANQCLSGKLMLSSDFAALKFIFISHVIKRNVNQQLVLLMR